MKLRYLVRVRTYKLLRGNPQDALERSYESQLDSLLEIRSATAKLHEAAAGISLQRAQVEQRFITAEREARQALLAGAEEQARHHLAQRALIEQEMLRLDKAKTHLGARQLQLNKRDAHLRARVEQFRTQQQLLTAELSAAGAEARVLELTSGIAARQDPGAALARVEDHTQFLRARASAIDELIGQDALQDATGTTPTQLDRELERIDLTERIEQEFKSMKREMS